MRETAFLMKSDMKKETLKNEVTNETYPCEIKVKSGKALRLKITAAIGDRSCGTVIASGTALQCFIKGQFAVGTVLDVLPIEISSENGMWQCVHWSRVMEVANAIKEEARIIDARFAFGRGKDSEYDFEDFLFAGTKGYLTYLEKVTALIDVFPEISNCTAPLKMKDAIQAILRENLD